MSDPQAHLPAWRRYLRFWGADVGADVNEEITFHIDALTAEFVSAGMDPSTARAAATARFGNTTDVARTMRALAQQRESAMARTEWVDAISRDLRFAIRQLGKRRGFTIVALVTLALGIGANTAIFSAVNTVLLHPIAAPGLDRLAVIRTNLPTMNLMDEQLGPGEALDILKRNDLFDASSAWAGRTPVLTEHGDPRRLTGARTMGRFFEVFGVAPALGRLYRPDESEHRQFHVVVLSHSLWQELGADTHIIGKSLRLSDQAFEVVGVTPANFDYPRGAQVYFPSPIDSSTASNRGQLIWNVVGRIKTGLTAEQFAAGIKSEQARWHQNPQWGEYKKFNQFLSVIPLGTVLAGQLRPVLIVLLAAVAFVLLIACANVACLQLVHATARTRELAVRAALGADRGTLIRQLLVENLVLSIGGGVLGLGVGAAMLALLARAGAADLPALQNVHLDGTVLAFAAITTIAAGLIFGIAPALRGGRVDLNSTLKEATRGASIGAQKNRVLQFGVVAQVALTLMLLLGSGLMIRSLNHLLSQNPGFNAEQVVTMRITVAGQKYNDGGRTLTAFYGALLDRVRVLPGVTAVGLTSDLPFSGSNDSSPFRIIGRDADPTGPALHANMHAVSDDYFKAMGIPLLRGRVFDATDVANSPQGVVIDEQLAKQFFPNEDPIGKQINQGPDATIIGVVGTVSQGELGEPAKATTYYSWRQHNWYSSFFITVRSALPPATVQSMVRNAVASVDPNVPVYDLRTLGDRISTSLAPRRLAMAVLTALAVLSLLLSVFGLYGVISYAVSQRESEFAIRTALGAQANQISGLVVKQGLALALVGVGFGLVGAALLTRAMAALLFGISPRDPATFVGAAVLLTAVAVAASYIPARRASRVELVDALRA
jgi:putative ABC transport system permease protein